MMRKNKYLLGICCAAHMVIGSADVHGTELETTAAELAETTIMEIVLSLLQDYQAQAESDKQLKIAAYKHEQWLAEKVQAEIPRLLANGGYDLNDLITAADVLAPNITHEEYGENARKIKTTLRVIRMLLEYEKNLKTIKDKQRGSEILTLKEGAGGVPAHYELDISLGKLLKFADDQGGNLSQRAREIAGRTAEQAFDDLKAQGVFVGFTKFVDPTKSEDVPATEEQIRTYTQNFENAFRNTENPIVTNVLKKMLLILELNEAGTLETMSRRKQDDALEKTLAVYHADNLDKAEGGPGNIVYKLAAKLTGDDVCGLGAHEFCHVCHSWLGIMITSNPNFNQTIVNNYNALHGVKTIGPFDVVDSVTTESLTNNGTWESPDEILTISGGVTFQYNGKPLLIIDKECENAARGNLPEGSRRYRTNHRGGGYVCKAKIHDPRADIAGTPVNSRRYGECDGHYQTVCTQATDDVTQFANHQQQEQPRQDVPDNETPQDD